MVQERNNQATRKHWEQFRKSDVPAFLILWSSCKFRIKRNVSTGAIFKFKARFCADARTQELGINFYETCALFVK